MKLAEEYEQENKDYNILLVMLNADHGLRLILVENSSETDWTSVSLPNPDNASVDIALLAVEMDMESDLDDVDLGNIIATDILEEII